MPLTKESIKGRVDSFAAIGGFVIIIESILGVLAVLGLDLRRTNELVMGISFVLGFPMYLFDLWIDWRIAVSLLGLFLFRWIARCLGGPTMVLCNPLDGSTLLIVAFALLQTSKLRRKRKLRPTA